MKGRDGDLEAESGEDEGNGDVSKGLDVRGIFQGGCNVKDVGGAGGSVEKSYAIKEECSSEGAEEEIFEGAFGAFRGMAAESGEDVAGDGRDFKGDEDEHEFDGGGHEAHADRAQEDEGVVFATIDLLQGEVVQRHEDGRQGDNQDDEVKEDAEVIDPQHVMEAVSGKLGLRLVEGCGDGDEHAKGSEDAKRLCGCVRRAATLRRT